jgi:hypothetical protein
MANMRIYTLWHRGDDDEAPWIIDAVDEYTIDNNCEFPPPYLKKREDINVRELILDVPEAAVRALFESPGVKATVVQEPSDDGGTAKNEQTVWKDPEPDFFDK